MKKTTIIILAVLPIILVISISFAAKILSIYQHISVEKVRFVDESNVDYEKDFIYKIEVGDEKQLKIRVYPDLATNKKVEFSSTNSEICSVDQNGVIKGISAGSCIIIVKTEENSMYSMLIIRVTQDRVSGVTLPFDEIELTVGDSPKELAAIIEPYVAINKNVKYTSSDTSVATVDENGNVKAVGVGQAIITVTTEDGGFTDTCLITCKSGVPAMLFDLSTNENFIKTENGYITQLSKVQQINLLNYLQIDTERVIINDIRFKRPTGSDISEIDKVSGDLVITGEGIIAIVAYVGDENAPTYKAELKIMVQ